MQLSVDATGSIIKPPKMSQTMDLSEMLKHMFLYQIMAMAYGKSVPVAQIISQDQSSDFIEFFFKKMFKDLKDPIQFNCDEGKALMKAIVKVFCGYESVKMLIRAYIDTLLFDAPRPQLLLQIDRSHMVKNITKKIKYSDFRKQNFFRCTIGYLIQCANFEAAKKIIEDFFTIIMNSHDGNDEYGKPLPSESAKKRLLKLCSSYDESADYETPPTDEKSDETYLEFDADTEWLDNIIASVTVKSSPEYHDSVFYSPNDTQKFKTIFSSIPLWSNIMKPIYGLPEVASTSSDCESHFKSIKHGILERKLYSVDKFFEEHIELIDAEVKMSAIFCNNASSSAEMKITHRRVYSMPTYRSFSRFGLRCGECLVDTVLDDGLTA